MRFSHETESMVRTYSFQNHKNIKGGETVPGPPAQNSAINLSVSDKDAVSDLT